MQVTGHRWKAEQERAQCHLPIRNKPGKLRIAVAGQQLDAVRSHVVEVEGRLCLPFKNRQVGRPRIELFGGHGPRGERWRRRQRAV